MKNKIFTTLIILLFIAIFLMTYYLIKYSDDSIKGSIKISNLSKVKVADNIINNISVNNTDINLKKWKKKQVKNYKYSTDLEFGNGNIIDLDIEAREVERELYSGVKTKVLTFNPDKSSIEPLIIRVTKGDKLRVNFKNSLTQSSTIHWHGIRVPNSQDGVPGLTQEAVPAGETFYYEFVVNDAGTFLFHPHANHSEQIARGLYGVLIVEDPKEPKYDKAFIWVLKDFRLNRDGSMNEQFDNMMDKSHGGRLGNYMTINNVYNYTKEVKSGDKVRLRIANMSNARIYNINFYKYDAKVIATDDGLINNPQKAYNIEIAPGERYDIELIIPDNKEKLDFFDTYFYDKPSKLATLNIIGKKEIISNINMPVGNLPDWREAKYKKPDIIIDLGGMGVMGGDKRGNGLSRGWTINDGIYPQTNKSIKLQKGKMYIIRMMNNSRRDHPMHLHGDFFQVINVNGIDGKYIGWKDTVNVKPKEYIDVAIIPTNIGKWAFHCHILEHADLGMFTTVDVE